MQENNLAKNIYLLRKRKGVTQEEFASAMNVSSQAVSKWETATSQPDVSMLPIIASYFDVSIDYLFYGINNVYGDIYENIYHKIRNHKQMSKEAIDEVINVQTSAYKGLFPWDFKQEFKTPSFMSSPNGLAVAYNNEYGLVVSNELFKRFNNDTIKLTNKLFKLLQNRVNTLIILAIISMDDISYNELKEKTKLSDKEIESAINELVNEKIVIKDASKHKSLGTTYHIKEHEYIALCSIFAAIYILQDGRTNGVSCCFAYGDLPISI